MAAAWRQLETGNRVQLIAALLQPDSDFHFCFHLNFSLFFLQHVHGRKESYHLCTVNSFSWRKCVEGIQWAGYSGIWSAIQFYSKRFQLMCCMYSLLGEKTNSCKQHLVSKSSLCKNSQQLVVARVCYLKRVYCLAEVWEYIIKITLWHWSLTASIFWCNLSSCFSRPDAGLRFQTEHKGHIWL